VSPSGQCDEYVCATLGECVWKNKERSVMGHPGTTEYWAGEGGNAYTARNRVDWCARIPFWTRLLDRTGARSVCEYGCNAGWNLSAIRRVSIGDVQTYGVEINEQAALQCAYAGHEVERDARSFKPDSVFDLTFTAGVLIHVAPAQLEGFMREVIRTSSRFVLAIEYEAAQEEEVEYRGERGLLWKRPYGQLYEWLGLRLVGHWAPEHVPGFDNCTAWLLEKP
jgi:pseudaminic acid biosynthesis-associated methylase